MHIEALKISFWLVQKAKETHKSWLAGRQVVVADYNMTVWILARNVINFSMAAGLIRLHMPGVKQSRV